MFDVAAMDPKALANAGVEMELVDTRTGNKTGVFITVLGVDSDVAQDYFAERVMRAQRQMRKTGQQAVESVADMKARRIELAVACTVGWRNMTYQGKDLPFTAANATMLYGQVRPILDQVDAWIAETANFLPS